MTTDLPIRPHEDLLSISELAERCELHPDLVRRFVQLGLIEEAVEEFFQPEVALRVQRILRLRRDLGVNYAGVGVVLDLLDRIEILEARLRSLGADL